MHTWGLGGRGTQTWGAGSLGGHNWGWMGRGPTLGGLEGRGSHTLGGWEGKGGPTLGGLGVGRTGGAVWGALRVPHSWWPHMGGLWGTPHLGVSMREPPLRQSHI